MNKETLAQFLINSNVAGYASGEEKQWIKEPDGSTSIHFKEGDWHSNDNFFGGEPYGGRVIVFFEDKPYWMMVYYGWVEDGVNTKPIYEILQNALKEMPLDHPYRGPERYEKGDYIYSNVWQGEVDRFSGSENITKGGQLVYKADYLGGLVDQRAGTE